MQPLIYSIDPGASTTKIIDSDGKILFDEPSVVAEDRARGFIAFGKDAWSMLGKTPPHIRIHFPFQHKRLSDYDVSVAFFQHLFNRIRPSMRAFKPTVIVNLYPDNTQVEKEAFVEALSQAGARKVYIIDDLIALGLGAGLNLLESRGNMVMDLGFSHTEAGLISMGHTVKSASMPRGFSSLRQELIQYFQHHLELLIGELTAEEILQQHCRCVETTEDQKITLMGLDLKTGLPKQLPTHVNALTQVVTKSVEDRVEMVFSALEGASPDLVKDIMERGIILGGGGARIPGIDSFLEEKTQIHFILPDNPQHCVVKGAMASYLQEGFRQLTTHLL